MGHLWTCWQTSRGEELEPALVLLGQCSSSHPSCVSPVFVSIQCSPDGQKSRALTFRGGGLHVVSSVCGFVATGAEVKLCACAVVCCAARLIPIRTSEWPQVHDDLLPGTEVVVRVHKINDYPKYRCATACNNQQVWGARMPRRWQTSGLSRCNVPKRQSSTNIAYTDDTVHAAWLCQAVRQVRAARYCVYEAGPTMCAPQGTATPVAWLLEGRPPPRHPARCAC
jgi:hypothetical protein